MGMVNMNKFEGFILILVFVFAIGLSETVFKSNRHEVKYDCRLVDVSPDMPEEVKRICRSRR